MTVKVGDWLVSPKGHFKVQTVFDPPFEGSNGVEHLVGTFYNVDGHINTKDCVYWSPHTLYWEIVTDEELIAPLTLKELTCE